MSIRWTATALRQLGEVPSSVGDAILHKVELAHRFPDMYPERRRGPYRGYRWIPVSDWLVFYERAGKSIVVIGILHGATGP